MEPLIFIVWLLLIVGVPIALIVASFVGLRGGSESRPVVAVALVTLLLHVVCVGFSVIPMFVLMYAGAHTDPRGQALSTSGRILFISIEALYATAAFSLCTYLAGRKRPWPMRVES